MPIDQRLSTERVTSELIRYIVEKIVSEIKPEKIILFGSYARGNFNQESDLDLLIIKDADEPSRMVRRKIDALLRGRRFAVDLLVRKTEEIAWNLKAENQFYLHNIFKDVKVLYERVVTKV